MKTRNDVVDPSRRRDFLEEIITDEGLREFYLENKKALDDDKAHHFSPLERSQYLVAKVILDDIFRILMNMTQEEREEELRESSSIYNKHKMFLKMVMELEDKAKIPMETKEGNNNPLMELTRLEGETEGEKFSYKKEKKEEPIDID